MTVWWLWGSSRHNLQKADTRSRMEVMVLLGVAVMKPHKSTGLTILNWTKHRPLHTTTCIPFLPQLPTIYLTYNSGSYVYVYVKCSSSVSLCTCPKLMKYTGQTVTSAIWNLVLSVCTIKFNIKTVHFPNNSQTQVWPWAFQTEITSASISYKGV